MGRVGLILLKFRVSFLNILKVLIKPLYLALFIIFTFIVATFIIWSLNLELLGYILFDAPISFADKLQFFSEGYLDIFTTFDNAHALGILVFSVLFGVNTSVFIYVLRRKSFAELKKHSGASGAGFAAAVISGGCAACGTSLLAPIAATLGATSGAFLRDLSFWLNWVGSALILYSLYHLGLLAARNNSK